MEERLRGRATWGDGPRDGLVAPLRSPSITLYFPSHARCSLIHFRYLLRHPDSRVARFLPDLATPESAQKAGPLSAENSAGAPDRPAGQRWPICLASPPNFFAFFENRRSWPPFQTLVSPRSRSGLGRPTRLVSGRDAARGRLRCSRRAATTAFLTRSVSPATRPAPNTEQWPQAGRWRQSSCLTFSRPRRSMTRTGRV